MTLRPQSPRDRRRAGHVRHNPSDPYYYIKICPAIETQILLHVIDSLCKLKRFPSRFVKAGWSFKEGRQDGPMVR